MAVNNEGLSKKKRGRLEHRLRIVEKRDRMLHKDRSSNSAVIEEVFDRSTLMTIYHLLNRKTIKKLHGVVNAGKEARIYWGINPQGGDLAVKIYLTVSAEFRKGMLTYIQGDHRFKRVKKDTRSLVYTWAQKEYKNLHKAYEAGVRVPKPIFVEKNVLIMEFIGKKGVSAPLIREEPPKNPKKVYEKLLNCVKTLYQKAKLVHGDLSEYNVMMWNGEPVIFDVSQAVPLEHPMAGTFLRRDLENLNHYFKGLGVKVKDQEEVYKWVTENG